MFLLVFILYETLLPGLWWLFPFPCYRSFQLLSLQIFSQAFFHSLLLGPLKGECWCVNVVSEFSQTVSFPSFFFLYSVHGSYFHQSISQLTYAFFCLFTLLMISPSVFFISAILLFNCLFFISLSSLLNISSIFWSMPLHFFWDFVSFSLSLAWILFQVDCLSPPHLVVFLGGYFVPSSVMYSSAVLCFLISCDCSLHSIGCMIVVPLVPCDCPLLRWGWSKRLVKASW